jgi:exocyst complex component 4
MAGRSEASGLLMSVIRTLHETDTGQEREEEKRKLETEFKQCDTRLDRLVASHQGDLSAVMTTYSTVGSEATNRICSQMKIVFVGR